MSLRSIERSSSADTFSSGGYRRWHTGLLISAVCLLVGCSSAPTKPDLKRLYQSANLAAEQPPLILIPGIMGSKLRDKSTQGIVWPGSIWRIAFHDYRELALDIDPATLTGDPGNIEAFALTDTAAGQHFYDTIIDTLVDSGSFEVTTPGTPVKDPYTRHLYLFPYDWRLDNVETARKLSALIDQLRIDYGRPDLKVDIVAHSMGGIVSRYLLEFGTEDALNRDDAPITMAGESKINRLMLLGTPSLGAANTIENLIEGSKFVVERIAPETLSTLPSVYQLLPNSDRKPLIGIDGRPLRKVAEDGASPERDIFDIDTWRELQWSVFNPEVESKVGAARAQLLQEYFAKYLLRARRLQKAMEREQPASSVKLIVFGADCKLTLSRVLVESDNGRMVPRFEPQKIKHPLPDRPYDELIREPGDGQVTKASLLGRQSLDPIVQSPGGFPIAFSFFLCSEHSDIPGNINFQDNLLNAILSR
jgi:pimeloyl-ACP methyl ester carboxylesterase